VSSDTTTTVAADHVGSAGLGDPYFSTLGNGGYDVDHYDLALTIDPETGTITDANATISATATIDLRSFDLDFAGLQVDAVKIDGAAAEWRSDGEELEVTSPSLLPSGEPFTVDVDYAGRPRQFFIPSIGVEAGWIVGPEGVYVVAEPDGAHTWFPGNDHPSDKATFAITVTVPIGWVVASNGTLVDQTTHGSNTTFAWVMDEPMATYLATVAVGEYTRVETPNDVGVVLRDYLPADLADRPPAAFAKTAEMLTLFEDWFGPYPFTEYGHVVVPDFPGALETQTMTVIGRPALSEQVVAHELAHAWFGDDVSPADWSQVWLNEGFATFAELLWAEHTAGPEGMAAEAERMHEQIEGLNHRAITDPTQLELFGQAVYLQGGLALYALYTEVGDDTMREILRTYAARHGGGSATTEDFLSVAAELSGIDVAAFLDPWLHGSTVPDLP
jgi:aminopeptidase N